MNKLDYAGDLTPVQSWELLSKDKNCYLVDCRTSAEWQFVGIPDLETLEKKTLLIEWQIYPSMSLNDKFLEDIKQSGIQKQDKLIFICRSGGRSRSAAEFLVSQGYENSFNCIHGFEGNHNPDGHRGKNSGWKFSKLPWKQG